MRMQVLWVPLGQQSVGSAGYRNLKLTVGCRLSLPAGLVGCSLPFPVSPGPTLFGNAETALKGTLRCMSHFFPVGEAQGLELAPPIPHPPLPKANMTLAPRPSALSLATAPPVLRDDGTKSLCWTPRLWGWTRPAPYGSCRLRARGMRWEGHLPNLFTGPSRYLQLQSAASLISAGPAPGSQQRPPTAHFCQRLSCYRNMHTELGSRVCVCAQVCAHTPESLGLGGGQGAWGVPQEAATPGLISHSENLPTILILLMTDTSRSRKGLPETLSFPQMFLTHSCLFLHGGPIALHGQSS